MNENSCSTITNRSFSSIYKRDCYNHVPMNLWQAGGPRGVQYVGGVHGVDWDTVHRLGHVDLYTPVKVTTLLEHTEWELKYGSKLHV